MRDNLHRGRLLMWNCIYARHTSAFLLLIIVAWIYPCVWCFASLFFSSPSFKFHFWSCLASQKQFETKRTFFFCKGGGGLLSDHPAVYSSVSRVPLFFPYSLATRVFFLVWFFCFRGSIPLSEVVQSGAVSPTIFWLQICALFSRPTRLPEARLHSDKTRFSKNASFFFLLFFCPPRPHSPFFLWYVTSVVQIRGEWLI